MLDQMNTQSERKAIEAELVKAYFKDAGVLNLAGSLVFLLLIFVVHDATPLWTWAPAVAFLLLVSFYRAYHIRQYRRMPECRDSRQWINGQTVCGGLAGVCWGMSSAAMLANLPTTLQLFVLTVITVVAAAATFESFFLVLPPRAFILASISPPTLWLFTVGDSLHTVLAAMLLAFMAVAIALGNKKSRIFTEAQHLRFQNEFLARELSRQHDLLERASKSKSRFLAAASHDLRQPIHAQGLFLEVLSRTEQTPHQQELVSSARAASEATNELLNALLDFSRIEAGVIVPRLQPFRLQPLLNKIENELAPQADAKDIVYRSRETQAVVHTDPMLLELILRNLVSNAIRYTEHGGVLVACRQHGAKALLEVWDTGIGIAQEHQKDVFREFHQLGNPERNRNKGLGLGLAIAEGLTRMLGHELTLSSVPQRGSVFRLMLDIDDTIPAVQAAMAQSKSRLLNARLLIIDDDEIVRSGMLHLLRDWGCECDAAETIEEALALARLHRPDVVISDYRLREQRTGVEAIAALRALLGESLPALLITGDTAPQRLREAQASGIPLLHKPVSPDKLYRRLIELQQVTVEQSVAEWLKSCRKEASQDKPAHPVNLAD